MQHVHIFFKYSYQQIYARSTYTAKPLHLLKEIRMRNIRRNLKYCYSTVISDQTRVDILVLYAFLLYVFPLYEPL